MAHTPKRGTVARFFWVHAGYSTPPGRLKCARQLAKAEAWLEAQADLEVVIEGDERAYCYCDDPACRFHEGSDHDWETVWVAIRRKCPDHGLDCRHAETLAGLGGIMDPDRTYLRVVTAELALEVMDK